MCVKKPNQKETKQMIVTPENTTETTETTGDKP